MYIIIYNMQGLSSALELEVSGPYALKYSNFISSV
jgi:hypothetical protein